MNTIKYIISTISISEAAVSYSCSMSDFYILVVQNQDGHDTYVRLT